MSYIPFLTKFSLGAEIIAGFPFIIKECTRNADNMTFIVSVYCKINQSYADQEKLIQELEFWKMVNHPLITMPIESFNEESFIYILYPFPVGGNLMMLINDPSRSFTEGFARYIAKAMIDVCGFLHSNGIIHGALLPQNVIFYTDLSVSGWVHSAHVAFYKSQISKTRSVFTDMQDIAYTLCSLMRQRAGFFPRNLFHPQLLIGPSWDHLTDEFLSFIDKLWNAERLAKNIDYFKRNTWLLGNANSPGDSASNPVSSNGLFPLMSPEKMHPPAPKPLTRYLHFKMRERSSFGIRRWRRALGTLDGRYLILNVVIDEKTQNLNSDQTLPVVVDLVGKTAVVTTASRHPYMFGIQDIEKQRMLMWVRFDDTADYFTWKQVTII
jgi:serine/threonine protein kinase